MNDILISGRSNSIDLKKCFRDKEKDKCNQKKPITNEVTLVCGREVNRFRESDIKATVEFPIEPIVIFEEPVILARVEVDLDGFKNPVVSLDFSTFIRFLSSDLDNVIGIVLDFRLKRICNGREYVLKDYKFTRFILAGDGASYELRDSFKIMYCDTLNCKCKCCEYVVEFIGFRLFASGQWVDVIREVDIDDSFMRAIVQELC
jgi:hypothetical protein